MKKALSIVMIICTCYLSANARHVAGGELFYEYLGPGSPGTSQYRITLRLFRDCFSSGPLLQVESPTVGIYENTSLVQSLPLPLIGPVTSISLNTGAFPCLVGAVRVCYEMGIYSNTIQLADNVAGYTLSRIGCCRVDTISNLSQPRNVGSNYVTRIPGTSTLPTGHNSSPQFNVRDTALVCANKSFKLDFGAMDPDGDSLTFALCDAFTSTSSGNNAPPTPNLSTISLPYSNGYNGAYPLGSKVSINPSTGIISGIAPGQGQYVVNVCITEWRNGKAFSQHRKDFILKIQDCDFIEAVLPDKIVQCDDFLVHFENESTSSSITTYTWDMGVPSAANNISVEPTVDFVFPDTGRYTIKLHVTGPAGCVGDASTQVFVYPGFKAGFSVKGSCFQNPYQFLDSSYAKYGAVNSWRWDFGDDTTLADTSRLKNPVYKYGFSSVKSVNLIVESDKGCIDTASRSISILDKPQLDLPFRDTLICNIDTLALHIIIPGTATVLWTPAKGPDQARIINPATAAPLVYPNDTTKYYVSINDNGCVNTDSVKVNVIKYVTVSLRDTSICRTDTIRLHPTTNALRFNWVASTGEIVSNIKNPLVKPLANTYYGLTANVGKCEATASMLAVVNPYPTVSAGLDTSICFGSRVPLRGSMNGSTFSWSPSGSLSNANTLTPIAAPPRTTTYLLTTVNSAGCLKPVTDTVVVTVIPPVIAEAGRDTIITVGQPLQLQASGGTRYVWSPATGLSDPNIGNPVAVLGADFDSIRYHVRVFDGSNCYADDDVLVKVYSTGPDIFVPSAFTPNADGKNDVLRPKLVGITEFKYFSVYNRWGQLLFTTNEPGKGWDGIFNGVRQPSGGYVYQAEGTDFTGKTIFRKGTAVLIR
jgi:gliding motility-associated-like protein